MVVLEYEALHFPSCSKRFAVYSESKMGVVALLLFVFLVDASGNCHRNFMLKESLVGAFSWSLSWLAPFWFVKV